MMMYTRDISVAQFRFAALNELQIEAMACGLFSQLALSNGKDAPRCRADLEATLGALAIFDANVAQGTVEAARAEIRSKLPPAPTMAMPTPTLEQMRLHAHMDDLFAHGDATTAAALDALSEWSIPSALPIIAAMRPACKPRGAPKKSPPWRDRHDQLCLLRMAILGGADKHPASFAIVTAEGKTFPNAIASAAKNLVAAWDKKQAMRAGMAP